MRLLRVKSVNECLTIINHSFQPLSLQRVALAQAGGRYLAEEIIAAEAVPLFNRSTVDGYAVRAVETFGAQESLPAFFTFKGAVAMGHSAPSIEPGQCCYVPTGGMLPPEADAVVMMEYTEATGDLIQVFRQVAPGENRILRGEDLEAGEVGLNRGRKLRAPEIGILASLGITEVKVYRQPKVVIFSTGDELVPAETSRLEPGQIRDSNGPALVCLAERMGTAACYEGIIKDDYQSFMDKITSALNRADLVVISGGSSVGERDFTPGVLKELSGGDLLIEGIAIHPGKPTLLAAIGAKAVLGLPGHPISALNIFSIFGKAIVKRFLGASAAEPVPYLEAILTRNVPSRPGQVELIRVKLETRDGIMTAVPIFGRSGLLRTLADAAGIIWIDEESDGLTAGTPVRVFPWG